MNNNHSPVLIIGAGPAGYTAAIYAARAQLNPTLVMGMQPGGQLTITTDVENYPGFADPIQGPWLMEQMHKQAENVGVKTAHDTIQRVDFSKRPFTCFGQDQTWTADSVIIATGAQAKWLGLESEKTFRGFGVSACATCDGFFFKGKKVAVVGGGNTAVEEALYLTRFAEHVTLIHRRDTLRSEKIAQEKLFKDPKISIMWNTEVEEICGKTSPIKEVTHLKLKTDQGPQQLDVDGVFIAIGHTPMSLSFKDALVCEDDDIIQTKAGSTQTSVEGVFAAGDVQDRVYRQAVTAAGQGCMAALEAQKFLEENN